MSSKVLFRIALVLGVALAAWAGLALLGRSSTDTPLGFGLPHLSPDSTESIEYVGPGDTVRLARQGTAWSVNGHPAATKVVEAFFRALADTSTRSELVAESAESHARLGVDSAAGKRLTVTGGGQTLLDLWFGGRGPDFEGFYVRRAGDNRVFLLRGTFADLSVQPVDDWREKQVLAVVTDSLTKIDVARGKAGYSLTRSPGGWTISPGGGAVVDSARMRRYLAQLKEVRATGFPSPEQADSARFTPPERKLTLYGPAGQILGELSLDSLSSTFVLRKGAGTDLYTLDQKMTELLVPAESTLKKQADKADEAGRADN